MSQAEAGASTDTQTMPARSQTLETGITVSAVLETIMTCTPSEMSRCAARAASAGSEPESA